MLEAPEYHVSSMIHLNMDRLDMCSFFTWNKEYIKNQAQVVVKEE